MGLKSFTVRNIFSFTIKTIRPIGTQPADLVWFRNGPLCKVLWIVVHNKADFLGRRSWTWRIWTLTMSCSLVPNYGFKHQKNHPYLLLTPVFLFIEEWHFVSTCFVICQPRHWHTTSFFLTGLHYRNPYPRAVSNNHNVGHFLSKLVFVLW